MASISTSGDGSRRILFVDKFGKRRIVHLGKMNEKSAEAIRIKVESLNYALISMTSPDSETARWVRSLGDRLAKKLAAVGLIEVRSSGTLKEFIEEYISGRTDLKASTILVMNRSKNVIFRYFGESRPLRDITPGDCDGFPIWMKKHNYAEATAAKHLIHAKQFFTAARRKRLIDENPFEGIKGGRMVNPDRLFFVTREMTTKLIDACPCAEWRGIIALARYGGLRCPSEVLRLTWGDVDWEKGRMLIRAPKTEHHASRGKRIIPIFPELRPYLEELFELAEPGTVHVINRYREDEQNLRTTFGKIIDRAGLLPWPRLLQNLRATRETELAGEFPLHVVVSWIGNSQVIAARHYLSVTDDDFEKALEKGKNPTRKTTQSPPEMARNEATGDAA